jgi:hypothetical protein
MFKHSKKPTPTSSNHKERLLAKVTRPENPDACWGWTACVNDHGYGRIRIGGEEYVASRLSYAVHKGEDPAHLDVCHTCNNPPCTNPKHLTLGNHLQNMQYAAKFGRIGGPGVSRNRGASNPMARLSDADVAEIIRLYATGEFSQKAIGKRFGVRQGHVSTIITKARRSDVNVPERRIVDARYEPEPVQ